MAHQSLEVRPSKNSREVITADGKVLKVPDEWDLLMPGDAALSRRIKKDGPTWTMFEMKGRKKFSRGIWAPADRIDALEAELQVEREDPSYQKKLDAGRARRAKEQVVYAVDFEAAVFEFLAFESGHFELALEMSKAIAAHAVPVGSGTVARTQRIPIERRAEAAVIAWMRHQTTAYDHMTIPREKGARREVRRMLAGRSRELLERYRRGGGESRSSCPLKRALAGE
jgi:TfoX/Sxy family transcriptional regulator of competence genes